MRTFLLLLSAFVVRDAAGQTESIIRLQVLEGDEFGFSVRARHFPTDECAFEIPVPPNPATGEWRPNVRLTPTRGVAPTCEPACDVRERGWTYEFRGASDQDCGITVHNADAADGSDSWYWKSGDDSGSAEIKVLTEPCTGDVFFEGSSDAPLSFDFGEIDGDAGVELICLAAGIGSSPYSVQLDLRRTDGHYVDFVRTDTLFPYIDPAQGFTQDDLILKQSYVYFPKASDDGKSVACALWYYDNVHSPEPIWGEPRQIQVKAAPATDDLQVSGTQWTEVQVVRTLSRSVAFRSNPPPTAAAVILPTLGDLALDLMANEQADKDVGKYSASLVQMDENSFMATLNIENPNEDDHFVQFPLVVTNAIGTSHYFISLYGSSSNQTFQSYYG